MAAGAQAKPQLDVAQPEYMQPLPPLPELPCKG